MSVSTTELLKLAEELLTRPDEAAVRAAASRAYYAAYHACLSVQTRLPYAAGGRRGTHESLIQDLREFLGDPPQLQLKLRAIGVMLHNAKDHRVAADYRITLPFPTRTASDVLDMCKKIIREATEAASMLNQPPRR